MHSYTCLIYLQGEEVHQDLKAGILVAGKNLVLQRVLRSRAGNYTCTASNDLGTAISDPVTLNIRCKYYILSQQ